MLCSNSRTLLFYSCQLAYCSACIAACKALVPHYGTVWGLAYQIFALTTAWCDVLMCLLRLPYVVCLLQPLHPGPAGPNLHWISTRKVPQGSGRQTLLRRQQWLRQGVGTGAQQHAAGCFVTGQLA